MPYNVESAFAPREMRSLARLEASVQEHVAHRHWLLDSLYGRDLLKIALRKLHPELAVSMYRQAPEADGRLGMVIDELELRDWKMPATVVHRARYLIAVARMYPAIMRGERSMRRLTS